MGNQHSHEHMLEKGVLQKWQPLLRIQENELGINFTDTFKVFLETRRSWQDRHANKQDKKHDLRVGLNKSE